MIFLPRRILSRAKMLDFLNELEKAPGNEVRSLYFPPEAPHTEIENALKEALGQRDIPPELAHMAANSQTGSVIFYSPERGYLLLPPFPVVAKTGVHGIHLEPLYTLLKRNHRIALILVRLGAYAIGICDGENIVSSKVGTGLVHGRHKKGGSSAHRFERHRDKQIEYFLSRVCGRVREQLEPQLQALDYIVYGGAWTTILLLQKQCPFFARFDKPTLPPLLDIPEPRQAVLAKAISHVWSSTLIAWRED